MATIRISNIEAKADAGSPSIDERVTFKRSTGENGVVIDAKQVGITSVGINTDNPRVSLDIVNTDAILVPIGTTGQRPTPTAGMIRYNSTEGKFEGYSTFPSSAWGTIGGFSVTNDTSTNSTYYPVFVDATSGDPTQTSVSSTKLNFNPSSGNFSATQFTSLSDRTKKTNIRPVENALEITKQLEGVRFDWIDNDKPSVGLIAQNVEKVLPELVETSDDGTKSVSYGNIIGVLVEAIKEQQKLIDQLMEK